jgi:polyisoprenyl-phosphate glycosyltransferase
MASNPSERHVAPFPGSSEDAAPASEVELSVVVAVYGCRNCLKSLHERLGASIAPITSSFELIFVDDRSPDGSWEVIAELAAKDPAVKAYRLSRNFGQHAAITAGLAQSKGHWTVVMDCDLQEPPEEIPRLYAKAQEGYDIVHGARRKRKHSWFRRSASRAYRRLMLESKAEREYSTLSMISRKVVNSFLNVRDKDREYLLVLDWLGYSHAVVEFEHDERPEGLSSYTFRRLASVALDGFFFRTTALLRWIVFAGFVVALGGFGLAAYDVYSFYAFGSLAGYTSLTVLLLLLSGVILISLGVVGLYVGRIFDQVKDRPLFILDQQIQSAAQTHEPASSTEPAELMPAPEPPLAPVPD